MSIFMVDISCNGRQKSCGDLLSGDAERGKKRRRRHCQQVDGAFPEVDAEKIDGNDGEVSHEQGG